MHLKASDRPVRVQYIKGGRFRFPEGSKNSLRCQYVGRPTGWANPYKIEKGHTTREQAVEAFRHYLQARPTILSRIRQELKGKNLACWCALDGKPCHADVLIEIANSAPPKPIDPVLRLKNELNEAAACFASGGMTKAELQAHLTNLLES